MDIQDFLRRLHGVTGGHGQWTARCPAHDDRHNSLSVRAGEDGKILLRCHTGCSVERITGALGLSVKDLFLTDKAPPKRPETVATYSYYDPSGALLAQKQRRADKSFTWRRPDGKGGWVYNRQGVPHRLYVAGTLEQTAFLVEGEKDADNLHKLGYCAVSGADGAGPGKWRDEYTQQLQGCAVCIFPDHDDVGRAYAQEAAAALHKVCLSVQVFDLSAVWPDIPPHGDISDLIARFGPEQSCDLISQLIMTTPKWGPPPDPFLACFKTLDGFAEEEADWLVPGWIPSGQITLMAADGGVGKTSLWVNLIAAVSSGTPCMLDPPGFWRSPQRVAFLTTEDSVRKKLKKKLRLAGANMANIITPDFLADRDGALRGLKFGSREMERFVRHFKPALCVFDPVQGFVPPDVNMGSRNAMRDCTAPLIRLGEETGATFLVVCHTNKRKGASGRDRIADSADLWDVARSVLMAGYTSDQGVRYLSNEKNNYAPLHDTLLFTIDRHGQAVEAGTSWKHDRDYIQETAVNTSAPKREDCKAWILETLAQAGGRLPSKELEEQGKAAGYSYATLRRAKDELKRAGVVKFSPVGNNQERVWQVQLLDKNPSSPEHDPTPQAPAV